VLAAYGLWGILPIYWKALAPMAAGTILAHRILWALIFTTLLVVVLRQGRTLVPVLKDPRQLGTVAAAALLIALNWWLYIWAVSHDRILETAFGYYLTPLVSMLLGLAFQKERLTSFQAAAFSLAGVGAAIMAAGLRGIPWISLCLCLSFGIYGLLKKRAALPALVGLQLETLLSLPLALALLVPAALQHGSIWGVASPSLQVQFLAVFAGPATAIPLWLFAAGAKRITMVRLGFAQYLSPTLSLLVGLFIYHEPFGPLKALAFGCIWTALAVFMVGEVVRMKRLATR
jgi:chloramphenicol-sensitive protein RarD